MDWSCLVWGTKMVLLWHHCETPVFKNAKSQDAGVILLDIHPPFFFFFLWLSLGMSWLGQKCRSAGMEAGMEGALCVNVWLFSEIFLFSFFFYVVQLDFKYCKPNAYGFSFLLICLRWMIYVCFAAVHCPPPPEVKDAEMFDPIYDHVPFGHVLSYHCRTGTLMGEREIYCTKSGTWSAPPPKCKGTHIKSGLWILTIRL